MTKARGSLFVFEGADGVGKSELSRRFTESLTSRGVQCKHLAFPGRVPGTLGDHVYRLHHAYRELGVRSMTAAATQLLHVAAHIDAIESQIMPLIRDGVTVVLDRFWWSTVVYGIAAGAARPLLDKMIAVEAEAWQGLLPSTAFLIRRKEPLRPEPELLWPQWVDLYDQLAASEAGRYPVCVAENDGTPQEALAAMAAFLGTVPLVKPINVGPATSPRDVPEPSGRGLLVFSSLAPAKPTKVFDTYWQFAAERQAIFFRRFHRQPPPWTADTILSHHKFTNAYRASDRVSQFLIRSVAYEGDQAPEELFFRIILFKFFNRIETWRLLERSLGRPLSYATYSFAAYDSILSKALADGERIYSAAYIMPTGNRIFGTARKHQANLRLLERMMGDEVPLRIQEARSMSAAFRLLRSYPMLGDFLAYQFVTDLNYSRLTDFSEMDFVVPGPGARDGIAKCFSSIGGLAEADLIKVVADRQEQEFCDRGITFESLWGRRLQLIDCQNLFCEVDKYARVKHPDVVGRQARTRIKQRFSAIAEPVEFWYPPKWGINERIAADKGRGDRDGTHF